MSKLLYARVITSGAEHIKPDDIKQHFTLIYEREDQGAIQSGQDEDTNTDQEDSGKKTLGTEQKRENFCRYLNKMNIIINQPDSYYLVHIH